MKFIFFYVAGRSDRDGITITTERSWRGNTGPLSTLRAMPQAATAHADQIEDVSSRVTRAPRVLGRRNAPVLANCCFNVIQRRPRNQGNLTDHITTI